MDGNTYQEFDLSDGNGSVCAYVEEDGAICTWDGHAVAYLYGETVYGWKGHHIGWYASGIMYDRSGHPHWIHRRDMPACASLVACQISAAG